MLGIVIGLFLARLFHSYSKLLEVSFGLFIGAVFVVLVFVVKDEDLIEK